MKILTKRLLPLVWDQKISLRATLTSELLDINFNPEKDDLEKGLLVSVIDNGGSKKIMIEKV